MPQGVEHRITKKYVHLVVPHTREVVERMAQQFLIP
jgi:hypothetical protein